MVTTRQAEAIRTAKYRGWQMMAGDTVTAISPTGGETTVRCLMSDVTDRQSDSGLKIGSDGMRRERKRQLTFHSDYLGREIPGGIGVGWTFRIDGELWDLAEDEPIEKKLGPIGAVHGLVRVIVRHSYERDNSTDGSTFTVDRS